jgi:SAM-dependent methyltransferase
MGMTAERFAEVIKRHTRIHRAARRARFTIGHFIQPRRYDGIPGRVHFNDFMFLNSSPEEISSYAERGRNVIALIEETLDVAGRSLEDIGRWLDFGCGYGRILRFLLERVPPERVSASDVIAEGVEFCRSEFDVTALHSERELAAVRLGSFDFLYAISVITHLNERNSIEFLRLVGESLAEGGIAMFTTHGQWSLEHPELYGVEYEARRAEIEAAVRQYGIAYHRYPYAPDDYGMTWHSREFIEARMAELHRAELVPLLFKPHGLDGHQDVYAFRRLARSA